MASLAHVLLLVFAAAMTKPASGNYIFDAFEDRMALMMENGCLSADFQPHDFSECKDMYPGAVKMQCIATSSGFSTSSGYDQAAAEAFIDARSSDVDWRRRQKELLSKCASMLMAEVPADKQGVFVQACLHYLRLTNCSMHTFDEALAAVDGADGHRVAQQMAQLAEGMCAKGRLSYPSEVVDNLLQCVVDLSFQVETFEKGFSSYRELSFKRHATLTGLTAEDITALGTELDKEVAIFDCWALSMGILNSDSTIDYNIYFTIIDGTNSTEQDKNALKNSINVCKSKWPASFQDFHTCWMQAEPYECARLEAYALVTQLARR